MSNRTLGYARVSTKDQSFDAQLQAIGECDVVYKEKLGAMKERPELNRMMDEIQEGDTLIVYKFDRLARSLKHLIQITESLREKGVNLVSIKDNIDTTSATGRLMFNIVGSFAEFEREIIVERTLSGLGATKENGTKLGRKFMHLDWYLRHEGTDKVRDYHSVDNKMVRMSTATFYRTKKLVEDFRTHDKDTVCEKYKLTDALYEWYIGKITNKSSL